MIDKALSAAEAVAWLKERAASGAKIVIDSRAVEKGAIFVALKGRHIDSARFLPEVAQKGAAAALVEKRDDITEAPLPVLSVADLAHTLGDIASLWYGEPSAHMRGIAVTGTNGKTSTSHWIAALLTALHHPCAAVGTIGAFLGEKRFETPALTTPDAASNQALFRDLFEAGAQAFAMEASSIGLEQGRLAGTRFETAVFTNLTRDHLDYHGTLEAYENAKALLFVWPQLKNAVINADDEAGRRLIAQTLARGVHTVAYTTHGNIVAGAQMLEACNMRPLVNGMAFDLVWQGKTHPVCTRLLGRFNVENVLAAAGAVLTLGLPMEAVVKHLETLRAPAGRLEVVNWEGMRGPLAVVDYAHTPDALAKALAALRDAANLRGGEITVVFGAGGDRDRGKRPLMGRAADLGAEQVIITSDNPRNESPGMIAAAVAEGVSFCRTILDRRKAIREAIDEAKDEDIVLIAGKGHEDYQEIRGVQYHFSDSEEAEAALILRAAHGKRDKGYQ
ncbi:MAG: UDP-N-acetylmuramoyl-L-alanyl-D-glutamate--2,6-diaminopimelate ligase [Duodenibacillus sp.]